MSATRSSSASSHARAVAEVASGRELAVLADGPWASHWYWREDLEQMQQASRNVEYPDGHPAAQHRAYRPTDEFQENPEGLGSGRVWRYRPPPAKPSTGAPEQAGATR